MKKSKLLDLIKGLNKEELKSLRDFLVSPYFNKKEELVVLYDYILKLNPDTSDELLDRVYVFGQLYPKKIYNEKEITYMMSFLSKLIERFLGQRKYEEDTELMQNHQLQSLMEHGLYKHYNYLLKRIEKYNAKQIVMDTAHYYNLHQLSNTRVQHYILTGGRTYDSSLQDAVDYLDLFYFSKKLQLICAMENRNYLTQKNYSLGFGEGLFQYVEESNLLDIAHIRAYYHIAKSITSDTTEKHFIEILSILNNELDNFNWLDKEEILLHGINISAGKMIENKKSAYYAKECLKIYKIGLEQELFIKNGYLPYWHFKNIVKLSLNLKQYEDTEQFIEQYSDLLEEDHRENLLVYSLAEVNYYRKNYDKAMEYLSQVIYSKDMYYQLSAKSMLARIYYETKQEELLLSSLASFKLFLRRNKKYSQTKIKGYLNFCNVLSRIMRRNKAKKASIKEQIETTKLIIDKRWLLKVLEETIPD